MPHNSVPAPSDPGAHPANLRLLVVASGNPGKLREFRALIAGLPFEVVAQGDLGVSAVDETGASFLENALLKARHAAAVTGAAALADDSGLEVDALGGAPGVRSARFAGEGADDAANNTRLLAALDGVPPAARTARYRCCLVFVEGPGDREPLIAEAVWEGQIATAPQGTRGFGYDPYFWLPERGVTAAELDAAEKNRLSHRGRALAALHASLAERVGPFGAGPLGARPSRADPSRPDPSGVDPPPAGPSGAAPSRS